MPSWPEALVWSPDGKSLAFTLFVPDAEPSSFLQQAADTAEDTLEKPADAQWAAPVHVTQAARYRQDGGGWLKSGHRHLFVLSVADGTLRQIGSEPFDDSDPAWFTPSACAIRATLAPGSRLSSTIHRFSAIVRRTRVPDPIPPSSSATGTQPRGEMRTLTFLLHLVLPVCPCTYTVLDILVLKYYCRYDDEEISIPRSLPRRNGTDDPQNPELEADARLCAYAAAQGYF